MSYPIAGGDFDSAGLATRQLKDQLARLGVDASDLRRAMIAAYEAEMNVVIHARTGTLWARVDETKLDLEVADEGPGIPDVTLAMQEGWSTAPERARRMGFGAGLGLPNIRKASDLFQIETRVGRGTRVRSTILFDGAARQPIPEAAPARPPLRIASDACRGCRRCVVACPTGALRFREDRPVLLEHLCIGCAACIDECPDSVFAIEDGGLGLPAAPDGALLIAPRGLLTGLPGFPDLEAVLGQLRELGFHEVRFLEDWEEALRSEARQEAAQRSLPWPRIPPLCPPVVSLIESRFPSLMPNLSPFLTPLESAGEEFPLRPVFLAAACPGQYGLCVGSSLTGRLTALTPASLAAALRRAVRSPRGHHRAAPASFGAAGAPGGLAASGPRGVLRVLARAETGALADVELLDLHLCPGGCSASPLLTADPELSCFFGACLGGTSAAGAVRRTRPFVQRPGLRLDADMAQAIRKLALIDGKLRLLPGRDCASCGSPSCAAFAEDIVMGRAAQTACPFVTENTP